MAHWCITASTTPFKESVKGPLRVLPTDCEAPKEPINITPVWIDNVVVAFIKVPTVNVLD